MVAEDATPPQAHHESLRRRGIRLEWTTNGWNLLEVFISITLGIQAQSLALIAFGLDSVVEVFASTIVIRNLSDQSRDPGDRRIHRSLRLLSAAFWLLGGFLLLASVRGLVLASRPMNSTSWHCLAGGHRDSYVQPRLDEEDYRSGNEERDPGCRIRDVVSRRMSEYRGTSRSDTQPHTWLVVDRFMRRFGRCWIRGRRRSAALAGFSAACRLPSRRLRRATDALLGTANNRCLPGSED